MIDNRILPFDQYQRYEICARVIKDFEKKKDKRLRILDVGGHFRNANGDHWLPAKDFFLGHEVLVVDTTEATLDNYQVSDGRDLPFDDNSFDIVVSNDVLEHVPADGRDNFIKELIRVSKDLVILNFPYFTQKKALVEKILYEYIVHTSGGENRMLEEHIVNGLPNINLITNQLSEMSLLYSYYFSGDVDNWLKLMAIKYEMERLEIPNISNYIDNYINEFHFENEMNLSEGYRVTFLIDKYNELDIITNNFFEKLKSHERKIIDFPAETLITYLNMKKENEGKSILSSYHFNSENLLDRMSDLTIIEQTFVCREPNLFRIAILPATYREQLTSSLIISVVDVMNEKIISSTEVESSWLEDNKWFEIDFIPLLESKGQEFKLQISMKRAGLTPSFYYSSLNDYGSLKINGVDVEGNLAIKVFCRKMNAAEHYFLINQENNQLTEKNLDNTKTINDLNQKILLKTEEFIGVEKQLENVKEILYNERKLMEDSLSEYNRKILELNDELIDQKEQTKYWSEKYQQLIKLIKEI
ncbi:class I SAM-dependent methyltransferase [Paenibacillus lautus]|uniref:class I SAM-dependent methyltransferase n=1 Tax=Paenibacillus lautus TaxID=1401 RepID=UPI00384D745D